MRDTLTGVRIAGNEDAPYDIVIGRDERGLWSIYYSRPPILDLCLPGMTSDSLLLLDRAGKADTSRVIATWMLTAQNIENPMSEATATSTVLA